MPSGRQKCCFDTSAFNSLLDDAEQKRIVSTLKVKYQLLLTKLAIIEVVATSEDQRRCDLLDLMKRLSDGTYPLALPNQILKRQTKALLRRKAWTLTITKEDYGAWDFLGDPSLSSRFVTQASDWKLEQELAFSTAHIEARPEFQDLFRKNPQTRPRRIADLLRAFRENDSILEGYFRKAYKAFTGQHPARGAMWRIFGRIPGWPLYFASWGHEMFCRAISETNYGRRGKPGSVDLWCSGYLPFCDIFVTNDTGGSIGKGRGGQYRAPRLLNHLIPRTADKPKRTRILTYRRFRAEVLSSF